MGTEGCGSTLPDLPVILACIKVEPVVPKAVRIAHAGVVHLGISTCKARATM